MHDLAKYIDYTNLKPTTTKKDIEKISNEAIEKNYKSVCIHPYYLPLVKKLLENKKTYPITVVGFPLGLESSKSKEFQTKLAIAKGAQEIDMVINIAALKNKDYSYVLEDIKAIVKMANPFLVKVIIETCYLTKEEKVKACEIIMDAKAAFVKTSTGFGTNGATIEDIKLLKSITNEKIQIKASGGIKTKEDAIKMIEAGASRIGTSSLL